MHGLEGLFLFERNEDRLCILRRTLNIDDAGRLHEVTQPRKAVVSGVKVRCLLRKVSANLGQIGPTVFIRSCNNGLNQHVLGCLVKPALRFGLGRLLAGHPGAILSVWPKLQQYDANKIRSALGGQGSLNGISLDDRALGAIRSVTSLLGAELRPYLTIVALSLGVADALTLKICLMRMGATQAFEEAHNWALELLEAVGAGGAGAPATKFPVAGATDLNLFLHPMRLHPQMALAFANQLGRKGENPAVWRDIVFEALARTHVFISKSIARDIEENSYRQMIFHAQDLQRDAYIRSLAWHFDREEFDAAALLIRSLTRVYREVGNDETLAKYWSERLLEKLGNDRSTMSHDRLRAWLPTYSNDAIRRLKSGEVDEAERMFETARSLMERAPTNYAASLALLPYAGPSECDAQQAE